MGILRVLLALAVVIFHGGEFHGIGLINGTLAVQAFFLISGFYMTLILNEKYPSYKLFITNRLLKILPIYWIILVLSVVFVPALFRQFLQAQEKFALFEWVSVVFVNLFLLGQDVFMFLGFDANSGHFYFVKDYFQNGRPFAYWFLIIPQAWSISLEIVFYLIAPFIVKKPLKVILSIIIVSLLLRVLIAVNGFPMDPWGYRFFPTEMATFLLGVISYRFYKSSFFSRLNLIFVRLGLSGVVFVITATVGFVFKKNFFIASTGYLLFLGFALPFLFHTTKDSKWDQKIGELSYPIYLVHITIFQYLNSHAVQWNKTAVVICSSILISTVIVYFIFRPIEKYRQQRLIKSL